MELVSAREVKGEYEYLRFSCEVGYAFGYTFLLYCMLELVILVLICARKKDGSFQNHDDLFENMREVRKVCCFFRAF